MTQATERAIGCLGPHDAVRAPRGSRRRGDPRRRASGRARAPRDARRRLAWMPPRCSGCAMKRTALVCPVAPADERPHGLVIAAWCGGRSGTAAPTTSRRQAPGPGRQARACRRRRWPRPTAGAAFPLRTESEGNRVKAAAAQHERGAWRERRDAGRRSTRSRGTARRPPASDQHGIGARFDKAAPRCALVWEKSARAISTLRTARHPCAGAAEITIAAVRPAMPPPTIA